MTTFAADLARFGPESSETLTPQEAAVYTNALASSHYENFPVLSVFVPRHLRQHFANIYAYCRWSDDLADEVGDSIRSLQLLDWWEEELRATYEGQPRHPVMIALAETIQLFSIPPKPFLDLLRSFRRDQTQTRYETFADLLAYCESSANPVGELVLYLYRRHEPARLEASNRLCTGLQLANFWQDVAIDWQKGRVYLPCEDLRRFGISELELKDGVARRESTPEFRRLLAYQVNRAEDYLRQGMVVRNGLPLRLRMVLSLFGQGGLGILATIRDIDYNVLHHRPKLTKVRVVGVFAKAMIGLCPFASEGSRREQESAAKEGSLRSSL